MALTEEVVWRNAGPTLYADTDGRIVALLYRREDGWFLTVVDAPTEHHPITVGDTEADERPARTQEEAINAATTMIGALLDEGSIRKRFSDADTEAIREAAAASDALWSLDEARGMADGLGGMEYMRRSPAPRLRRILGESTPDELDALQLVENDRENS